MKNSTKGAISFAISFVFLALLAWWQDSTDLKCRKVSDFCAHLPYDTVRAIAFLFVGIVAFLSLMLAVISIGNEND